MTNEFRRNHYVSQWYQYRFLPSTSSENKFYYLDLSPQIETSNGHRFSRNAILRWGPPRCFLQNDLYTTKFDSWESTEIEEKFFGHIDREGQKAVDFISGFDHGSWNPKPIRDLLSYMSVQKLRTPKGLRYLAQAINSQDKNEVLFKMQELHQLFCAVWSESVWSIADASNSQYKFILSDHPICLYNQSCFPSSKWCRDANDPDVLFTGTHTLFPLDQNKILILTNLSWVRNPYVRSVKKRPNPRYYGDTFMDFREIQTGRMLTDDEVLKINYIIKKRAYRYIAAPHKEWLYPEKILGDINWERMGKSYLLMPEPRDMVYSSETVVQYSSGFVEGFDSYGRKSPDPQYNKEAKSKKEWETFLRFQKEFGHLIGPERRGKGFQH